MNNQLSKISIQYRKFSKGQYIEHPQFNEFLDFFDDQDRLSRVMLEGVGIVCGFQPQLIYTNQILRGIQLSQGVAITTDGDLLTLNNTNQVSKDLYVSDLKTINIENKNYTHFKTYDNYKVKYPAFYKGNNQIELWELATTSEAKSDFQSITTLGNLQDKYLLLYLESYEKEAKPCRGVDCDNHGVQQIRNLKVLVTNEDGIAQILSEDTVYPNPLFINNVLVDKKQKRVIIESVISKLKAETGVETVLPNDLKQALLDEYSSVVKNDNYNQTMFDNIGKISQIMGIPLLSTLNRSNFIGKLNDRLDLNQSFQYAYDVMKDLTDTYAEIIKLLPKSFTKCLPDLLSFPKHILLGKLITNSKLDYSRHQFYNSPVLDNEKTTQRVKLLVARFNQQVLQFKGPIDRESASKIQIIPSQKVSPLSKKAIPFYYDVTKDFLKVWNFDKTTNRASNTNLGFDTTYLSLDSHIQDPITYNIDKKSFYRIEGHQRMEYQTAVDAINQIRNRKQLGFDLMGLSLKELIGNKDLSIAYFNDYVERNSGLEHTGGVERGGTFAVVYESDDNQTIIADFSLPYLCCTPKAVTKLSLPSNVICAKASRIPFTVFPIHGVVKADVAANLNGGVELSNGQYYFNPVLVSEVLRDQDISFTVNDKPTNCKIKVATQSQVDIVVNSINYPDIGSNDTIVTFAVSGQYDSSYEFSWDFLGNGGYVTLNPINGIVTHTYFNLDVKNIRAIKVLMSGNGCSQSITISNWYSNPFIINNIDFPNGNCCENTASSCVTPILISATKNPDNTVTFTWNNNGFNYGTGTAILQYSIDNGVNWVSVGQKTPDDLTGTSSVINIQDKTPIKYRVQCHGNGCKDMASNIINDIFINPIHLTTYSYVGRWNRGDTIHNPEINSWVDYIDEFGGPQHFIIGAIEKGCQSIDVQSIISTNGVEPCIPNLT
jgi:hypothetical protein